MEWIKIVLDGVPPSNNRFNGRGNLWAYREAKQHWTQKVYMLCLASPQRPAKPFQRALVRIDYYFPNRRRRDEDNYSGKLFLDGLTKAGVIADDSFWVISRSIHAHVDRKQPRTEIVVVSLEDLELSDGRPVERRKE